MTVTWDTVTIFAGTTLTNGNKKATSAGGTGEMKVRSSIAILSTDKVYFEIDYDSFSSNVGAGICTASFAFTNPPDTYPGDSTDSGAYWSHGHLYQNGFLDMVTSMPLFSASQRLAFAVDGPHGKWYAKRVADTNWNNTVGADPATNTSGVAVPSTGGTSFYVLGYAWPGVVNLYALNSEFTGTVPSGFTALDAGPVSFTPNLINLPNPLPLKLTNFAGAGSMRDRGF
jgi:hypothetical protein